MSGRIHVRTRPWRVMPRSRQRRPDGRPLADEFLRPGERPSERRPIVTDDHQPVMVEEVLHFLAPAPHRTYVDATLGAGGHAEAVLRHVGGRCRLIGVDRDPRALERAAYNLAPFGDAAVFVRGSFRDLPDLLAGPGVERVDGVLFDLGMSSMQLDAADRGFSFRAEGPLDMRMDPDAPLTAGEVVNTYPSDELARILRSYGEERHARRIARAIVTARRRAPIRTTTELARICEEAYPGGPRRGHPARRTFQALRIEVNGELDALEDALRSLPGLVAPGGRVVVLSYHSLEDKLTKRVFADLEGPRPELPGLPAPPGDAPELAVLTRGAVLPSSAEVDRNPRASSARLRAAERLDGDEG